VRILGVSPRVTYPPERGSEVRAFNLYSRLSRRHEVRQFSQAQWRDPRFGQRSEEIHVSPTHREHRWTDRIASLVSEVSERAWVRAPLLSGAALRLRRPRELDRLFAWADVTLVEFPWQFEFCRRRVRGPLVLASHNVEALKFPEYAEAAGRPYRRDAWMRYIERAEARASALADLVLAVSPDDRRVLIERHGLDPSRIVVVPNGANVETFRPVNSEARLAARRSLGLPDRPVVLFAGSNVPPNRAGVDWIRRLAARTDRFTFVVVGPVARAAVEGNVVATGRIPDISAFFRAADLFACPIRHGGGTKIKLLEALAAGLPTVAAPESIHGLEVRDGEHLLVAEPDGEAWIAALNRLADDRGLSDRLSRDAAAFVALHHDWARIADDLEHVLLRLAPARRAVTP
jgi:polysaccharide biosynthesis protein PslH